MDGEDTVPFLDSMAIHRKINGDYEQLISFLNIEASSSRGWSYKNMGSNDAKSSTNKLKIIWASPELNIYQLIFGWPLNVMVSAAPDILNAMQIK